MLPSFCRDVVTVLRAPLAERRGSMVRDWRSATEHTIAGCSLQEGSSSTEFGGAQRDSTDSDATLYLPPGADIAAGDRVTMGSRRWEVSGVPQSIRSATGNVSHVRATLKEWRG